MGDFNNIRIINKDGKIVLAKIIDDNIVAISDDITGECIEALMYRMSELKRIKNNKECFFANPIGELHFKEYSPSKNYEHK